MFVVHTVDSDYLIDGSHNSWVLTDLCPINNQIICANKTGGEVGLNWLTHFDDVLMTSCEWVIFYSMGLLKRWWLDSLLSDGDVEVKQWC